MREKTRIISRTKNIMEVLRAVNISKYFNKEKIIDSISFSLNKGQSVAIVGQSGSGKTTFLQICSLIDQPDAGDIIVNGKKIIHEKDIITLRSKYFGFVYQYHHLLLEFSVLENLIIPQLIIGVKLKSAKNRALDLLNELGMVNKQNNSIGSLSGGERQRIAILRAIVNQPQIIFADEPTGNLDEKNSYAVWELLSGLKQHGHSVVIVTHNCALASQCDQMLVLKNKSLHNG
jgi:lipoprotein-releasing system ATP-binding protein